MDWQVKFLSVHCKIYVSVLESIAYLEKQKHPMREPQRKRDADAPAIRSPNDITTAKSTAFPDESRLKSEFSLTFSELVWLNLFFACAGASDKLISQTNSDKVRLDSDYMRRMSDNVRINSEKVRKCQSVFRLSPPTIWMHSDFVWLFCIYSEFIRHVQHVICI